MFLKYGLCLCQFYHSHSFIRQPVLQQVHNLFQREFATECDLVLPVSNFSILSFLCCKPVAANVFYLVYSSLLGAWGGVVVKALRY
jgi:hypothetical protein